MAGMNWIDWPITIRMNPNAVEINGVQMTYMVVAEIVAQIVHPDPRKWFRLERNGDIITVHVKLTEDEPNGTPIGTTGSSKKDTGRERAKTPHP
jgi:hypothetical protein